MDDPYVVLGVARDATQRDIRRSFRRLALKHHPDRNPGDPQAENTFKRINEAYQILGDPDRRSAFDAATNHPEAIPRTEKVWRNEPMWPPGHAAVAPAEGTGSHPPTPEEIADLSKRRRFVPWKAAAALFLALIGYVALLAAFDSAAGKPPGKPDPAIVEWLRRQAHFGQR